MSSSADRRYRAPAADNPAQFGASPLSLLALISGRGSNLQAIIDAVARGELRAVIRAVISNRAAAQGLERARQAHIPVEVVDQSGFGDSKTYEAALAAAVDRYAPKLIVLAGFMRILSPDFVRRFDGRMLNIHPSLLPEFSGLNTHRRVLEAGAREHGASVHFVTADVDGGPVILRARVPVMPHDDATTLAGRVLALEHCIYPLAIRWFAEGRVHKQGRQVIFDGQPLLRPLDYADLQPAGAARAQNGTTPGS